MLTHKGTQTIKTERLTLRRYRVTDAKTMYETWARDERVTKFLTWQPHASADLTKALLEIWCADYEKDNNYNWVIEFEGKIIGSITVVRQSERDELAELGYCLGHGYWEKGIMTEAAKAVIDFLFGEVGFNRISIEHAVKNPGSGKVAKKCGMTLEGTKREYFKAASGEFLDINEYSILRREWKITKGSL
ncbi:MAG: GNAT family N-acetyltransferase [Oscillospiraceae bacterium]|nr:GNAT family N-acetyltransferase [Oscillospiraceae bacterium]